MWVRQISSGQRLGARIVANTADIDLLNFGPFECRAKPSEKGEVTAASSLGRLLDHKRDTHP